jgi:hypothetical protein
MTRYLVEIYTSNRGDAVERVRSQAATLARSSGLRYVRSILVPAQETCFHVVEGASVEEVEAAVHEARVAVERIAEAVEVSGRTLREER